MLFKRCLLAFLALSLTGIVAAYPSHRARNIERALQSGFDTLGVSPRSIQEPAPAPTIQIQEAQPSAVNPQSKPAPIIPSDLWASLPMLGDYHSFDCPDCPTDWAKFSAERLPDADQKNIHVLPWNDINKVLRDAVDRRMFLMTLFTDDAFTTPQIYFIPQDVLTKIFSTYEMRITTIDHGVTKDKDGDRFVMCGLAAGNGQVNILYCRPTLKNSNWKQFSFVNPDVENKEFTVRPRVIETILSHNPEKLGIKGLAVKAAWGMSHPKILSFTHIKKLDNGEIKDYVLTQTEIADATKEVHPLSVKGRLSPEKPSN